MTSVVAADVKERGDHLAGQIYKLHLPHQLHRFHRPEQRVVNDGSVEWTHYSGVIAGDPDEACQPWLRGQVCSGFGCAIKFPLHLMRGPALVGFKAPASALFADQ